MCITTHVGAASEMIQNDINGWIIPANDEDELFQKIKNCIELNSETRKSMENKAQKNGYRKLFNTKSCQHTNAIIQN